MIVSPFKSQSWFQTLDLLRQFSQIELQTHWKIHHGDLPPSVATQEEQWQAWEEAALNARRHIAWPAGKQVLWLGQRFVCPAVVYPESVCPEFVGPEVGGDDSADRSGYDIREHQIRLDLTWWADNAQVFVNGSLVQEGDLFDCVTKFRLSNAAQPGEVFELAIRLVSPGHDPGALVLSQIRFEVLDRDCPEPSFVADELTVLGRYLEAFQPDSMEAFEQAIAGLPSPDTFRGHLENGNPILSELQQVRARLLPFSDFLKQRTISLLGHAHLDMAWLWPIAETWEAAERTFESALNLQAEFPHLIFGHSSPALYAWLQEHRPKLWQRVKDAIAQGQWEVIAGLWIEPDCILPSGESLIRQVLYGQRYTEQELGFKNRVAWLPDSFGFCNQLPQILKQGGVDYFVTEKLLWNDTTEFPHQLFDWRSPDGTSITSYMSARIGTQIDAVQMAEYACKWEQSTGIQEALWLPGVGDHGGGPTREMLETAERWGRSPFFPMIEFSKLHDYLDRVAERAPNQVIDCDQEFSKFDAGKQPSQDESQDERRFVPTGSDVEGIDDSTACLPVWNQDLYLEYHRGCYTTHADQKRYNREAEALLYQAELFSSLATIATGADYPKSQIEALWKKVLFNQFHDILPGTSIPDVFVDANRDWRVVMQEGEEILQSALGAISSKIQWSQPPMADAKPLVLFNPLNWSRSGVFEIEIPVPVREEWGWNWGICDAAGKPFEIQYSKTQNRLPKRLLIEIDAIPSVGYKTVWVNHRDEPLFAQPGAIVDSERSGKPQNSVISGLPVKHKDSVLDERGLSLQNGELVVEIDPMTGDLARVYSNTVDRELLSGPGNQLQAFQDGGDYWDAWNIKPDYEQHPLATSELIGIEAIAQGPLEWRTRVTRTISNSRCIQDYILRKGSDMLYIETEIDWQEDNVLLKAAFPLNLEASQATYETPCGTITRTTRPQTDAEKAQWEVPALRWANLTDNSEAGVSDSGFSNRGCSDTGYSGTWGVSLINNCKYGYDAKPNQLRLTLLRASNWPEAGCDRGLHQFTYALYPHKGVVHDSKTVQRGYELQQPLHSYLAEFSASSSSELYPNLPEKIKFLDLGSDSAVLIALKQSEASSSHWICRCYETEGKTSSLTLSSDINFALGTEVDGLERSLSEHHECLSESHLTLSPWKILAFQANVV